MRFGGPLSLWLLINHNILNGGKRKRQEVVGLGGVGGEWEEEEEVEEAEAEEGSLKAEGK